MSRMPESLSVPPDLIVFDGECVLCSGLYRAGSRRYEGTADITRSRSPAAALILKLTASAKGLHYGILKAPRVLLPKSDTWETADSHGRFYFNVSATAFMAGRLIHYQGALTPE